VDSDLRLFDVLVTTVIAIIAAAWIITFCRFWVWASLRRVARAPQAAFANGRAERTIL